MQELVLPSYDRILAEGKVWVGALSGTDWRQAILCLAQQSAGSAPVQLGCESSGKPCFTTGSPWQFNVTNSRDVTLAAFAAEPVGIDVEFLSRRVRAGDLASRYYASEEARWVRDGESPAEITRRFLILWTAKEALVKLDGCGLSGLARTRIEIPMDGETVRRGWLDARGAWFRQEERPRDRLVCVAAWQDFSLVFPNSGTNDSGKPSAGGGGAPENLSIP